eukprot:109006-Prymnesium_polylepis.1
MAVCHQRAHEAHAASVLRGRGFRARRVRARRACWNSGAARAGSSSQISHGVAACCGVLLLSRCCVYRGTESGCS